MQIRPINFGLALSFFTWHISSNGSLFRLLLLSISVLLQWRTIEELTVKFEAWSKLKNVKPQLTRP
jgi:hypothetical protein